MSLSVLSHCVIESNKSVAKLLSIQREVIQDAMYGKPSIVLLFFAIFKSTTCKDIGDRCSVFHRPGICTVDRECQPFWSMNIQERGAMFQGKCGFQGYRAILCCPITTAKAPAVLVQPVMKKRRKSQEACDSLEERPAKIVPRISGLENSEARNFRIGLRISSAEDAEEGDFPQFAALGYEDNAENRMTSVCGGVLISKNYVLTAAQCLSKQVKLVTLGTIALKAGVNFRAYLRRLEVNVKVRKTKRLDRKFKFFLFRTKSSTQIIRIKRKYTTWVWWN